jgi:hypothetical protein
MVDRVAAAELIQALTGGAQPAPSQGIVFQQGSEPAEQSWGFSSLPYVVLSPVSDKEESLPTVIQGAIDQLADLGNGGIVFLLEGTFLTTQLVMKSDITIMGSGWGTELKLIDGSNESVIVLEGINTERVGLIDLSINGNKANQSAGSYHGISFTNTSGSWSQVGPRHIIRNVLVKDCKADGVVLTDADWSQVTVYSSDNGSDGMNLASDFCNILLQAEGNGAYGLNLGTAVDNYVVFQSKSNSSGDITGTKDKNSIIFDHDFRLAGFFSSIIGTDGSSANQHFTWGKDGSLTSGNPLFDIITTADSVAKTVLRGNDGSTIRIFTTLDYENALIRLGNDALVRVVIPSFTNANRGTASAYPAGTIIWNTDDAAPNYSTGAAWVDAVGVGT